MYSASKGLIASLALVLVCAGCQSMGGKTSRPASGSSGEPLRVCADPNNLPFSNAQGEGFENRIASLVADELDRPLEYVWWPQRRGFLRKTLNAGRCDLVIGLPSHFEMTAVTEPYYRSSFVFITRREDALDIRSFDDPRLKQLAIGLHVIGDDYSNPPPAMALAQRGIRDNVHGYSIYGDYSQPAPTRNLINAVTTGEIDVAVVWGPLAGWFVAQTEDALRVTALDPNGKNPQPMVFSISMGVRHDDEALKESVETVLRNRRDEVRKVLLHYHVPLLEMDPSGSHQTAGITP